MITKVGKRDEGVCVGNLRLDNQRNHPWESGTGVITWRRWEMETGEYLREK